ncbi:AraC family transcriptional regulator [Pseudomonas sp. M30-35]|uniref:AraC family transcriptional regulator n=1 Tax=Pseudomonas sp. M30-35 TaxID=1981174 RepID=UPI000B3CC301|nr:AraC family transcriptional regulator [Pseudomonas sp. M30-35]ARU89877.1 AraC family transcriptional regulator [Pseudomonas sp. M30-35]
MRDLTDDIALMRPVLAALQASGTDPAKVLARIGLQTGELPPNRFSHALQEMFWQAVIDETGEEHAGLFLVEHLPIYQGLLLEYLFLSNETFGAGLRHALRYMRLLSDTLKARLDVEGGRAVLTLAADSGVSRHFPEMFAGAVIRLFNALTEGEFALYEVHFIHEQGASSEQYRAVYGCPAHMGSERYALVFDSAILSRSSALAQPEVLQMHDSLAQRQLSEIERFDLVNSVRDLIAELVIENRATLEQVSLRLGMPARRLRERLTIAGVRFNDLVSDYRCRLAKDLLLNTDERIEVIVELTGFSEPSTFYRAFKRWVGVTPVEYRNRRKA